MGKIILAYLYTITLFLSGMFYIEFSGQIVGWIAYFVGVVLMILYPNILLTTYQLKEENDNNE